MKISCLTQSQLEVVTNCYINKIPIANHHMSHILNYLITDMDWKLCIWEELYEEKDDISNFFLKKFNEIPEYFIVLNQNLQLSEMNFPEKTKLLTYVDDTIFGKKIRTYKTKCYNKCDAAFIHYAYNVQHYQPDINPEKLIFLPHSCYYTCEFNDEPIYNKIFVGGHIENYPPREHMVKLSGTTCKDMIECYKPGVGYKIKIENESNVLYGKKFTQHMNEFIACFTDDVIGVQKDLIEECGGNGYIVAKHFEILSSGSLLVSFNERTSDMFSLLGFHPNVHYMSVNYDNLENTIKYILNPKNRRIINRIRRAGYEHCIKYHNYTERAKYINQWTIDKNQLDLSLYFNKRYNTHFRLGILPYIPNKYHSKILVDKHELVCFERQETMNKIINGSSFIRFGDGEFNLMNNISINFQVKNPIFKEMFIEIMKNPLELNYIIGNFFKNIIIDKNSESEPEQYKKYKQWLSYSKSYIDIMGNKTRLFYHDALIFRSDAKNTALLSRDFFKYLKTKNICIINNSFEFMNHTPFYKELKYIKCKSTNCFDDYDDLYNNVSKLPKDYVILLSCGPCAKILGYNLIKLGYQVIDIGAGLKHLLIKFNKYE